MVSLEEQVVEGPTLGQSVRGAVQQRQYPAPTSDEVRRRIRDLGVSEANLDRHMPSDPEDFANHT